MGEEVAQRHQDSAFLLAAGGDHRLQAGIYRCPVVGAKTAAVRAKRRSAPPPDFGRAQVSFGPVVGERDTFHRREGRNRLVLPQAAIWGVPGPPGVRAVVLPVPPGSRSGGSVAGRLWPPLRARGEPARGGPTGRYASPLPIPNPALWREATWASREVIRLSRASISGNCLAIAAVYPISRKMGNTSGASRRSPRHLGKTLARRR
jgi:hypothetical protein